MRHQDTKALPWPKLAIGLASAMISLLFIQGRDPEDLKELTYELRDFESLNIGAGVSLKVIQDANYSVRVSGDPAQLENYVPFLAGTTLKIKYTGKHPEKKRGAFELTVRMPRLGFMDLNGASTATIAGFKSDSLALFISGKSNATFDGEYSYGWISVSGSSSLSGYGLMVGEAIINVSANSTCEFIPTKSLRGIASNGGRVRYKGSVKPYVTVSGASIRKVE